MFPWTFRNFDKAGLTQRRLRCAKFSGKTCGVSSRRHDKNQAKHVMNHELSANLLAVHHDLKSPPALKLTPQFMENLNAA